MRCLVWLLGFLACARAFAVCPPHALTPPEAVQTVGDALMVVVHASSTFDARFSSKRGVDEAVRFAKEKRIPVVYLQDDSPLEYYFVEDCEPSHWVASQGGEVRFAVPQKTLYIVGGHLELCLSAALHDIIYQWAKGPPGSFTINYFMDAIYSNGKAVDPGDPFYADFVRFMDIVTYGRPGGEHWPKLSLLETMGIIVKEEHELEYLRQILPRWDTTFDASYRIELRLNDSVVKVLRAAPGWHPPTVRFNFFDSAIGFSATP